MESIGIIAAMTQESGAVIRMIKRCDRSMLGPFQSRRFRVNDRDCLMVTSGMGIERAAQATGLLLEASHPQLLVSVGVAGAVNADLAIGDVVAAQNTCLLDQGKLGPFQPLALLSEEARQAVEQVLQQRQAHLFSGTAISTHGTQFIQAQGQELANPVLEMETVGIAQIAAQYGIPLLSLRAVSDGPRAPIPFDLAAMMDEKFNLRTGKLIRAILGNPKVLPQLVRMGQNTSLAAGNAAAALIAALIPPGPVITP
jgi:adenosylhomocysteine nucleosidase